MTIFYSIYNETKDDYVKGACNYEKRELPMMHETFKYLRSKSKDLIRVYKSKDYIEGYILR